MLIFEDTEKGFSLGLKVVPEPKSAKEVTVALIECLQAYEVIKTMLNEKRK